MTVSVKELPEACRLLSQLEELLETPIAAVVLVTSRTDLGFLTPAEHSERSMTELLTRIASAAWDASKSR